jgi:hypothetical protein
MTYHNQTKEQTTWFLNLSHDESIDNKNIKFEVQMQDPMKHSQKTKKPLKSSRRLSRRRKKPQCQQKHEKRQFKQNRKEELRKAQN